MVGEEGRQCPSKKKLLEKFHRIGEETEKWKIQEYENNG